MNEFCKSGIILKNYLVNGRKWVSWREIKQFLRNPPTVKNNKLVASTFLKQIDSNNETVRVQLKDGTVIYYPTSIDINQLYMVISQIYSRKHWHYYEIEGMEINKDDEVLDCGVAEGLFSVKAAKRCKKVYAIEPSPIWQNSLELTFSKYSNIELRCCALSDRSGTVYMDDNETSSKIYKKQSKLARYCVRTTTVDEEFLNNAQFRVSYIKADLEGSDLNMLKGAKETIYKFAPRIAITTYHEKSHAEEMTKIIKQINSRYRIKWRGIALKNCPVMLYARAF